MHYQRTIKSIARNDSVFRCSILAGYDNMIYEKCAILAGFFYSKHASTVLLAYPKSLYISLGSFLSLLEIKTFGLGSRSQDVCSLNHKSILL